MATDTHGADGPPAAPWAAAPWALATAATARGPVLPQAISHRGYKARFAENSMAAFAGAVRAGAHAIETDARLSADGVAVLSHDPTLRRCFADDRRVADCPWADLARLRSTAPPGARGEPMPRLRDLLAWLAADAADGPAEPPDERRRRRRVWVLLDLKMDDDAQRLVDAVAAAIRDVGPGPRPWEQRLMLGCWNASTLLAARRSLPSFPLAHIGTSLSYARHFLPANLALNMAENALVAPVRGRSLLLDAARRPVFAWTVNSERGMRWAIAQNLSSSSSSSSPSSSSSSPRGHRDPPPPALVDGVVTDDPARFLALCRRYEDELASRLPPPPATTWTETLALALRFLLGQLFCKLIFLYRRFWLRKLDYLPGPVGPDFKAD